MSNVRKKLFTFAMVFIGIAPTVTLDRSSAYSAQDEADLIRQDRAVDNSSPVATMVFEASVATSSDDAEERDTGSMYLTSSDLELVFDTGDQEVGMRFNGVAVPPGAAIVNAYVQFQVDEPQSVATSLTIQGEDVDSAAIFTSTNGNISSRIRTTAAVSWSPVPWPTVGDAGPDQRTPDIASVIQEIVDRPGWASGNSLAIIITGSGERVAESYDGTPTAAPLLHVEFTVGHPPTVTIITPADGQIFNEGGPITFSGSAYDAEDGDISASLVWASDLDGNIGAGGSFSTNSLSAGMHTITASVSDSGGSSGSGQIGIIVDAAGNDPPIVAIFDPTQDGSFTPGAPILFAGTASDIEDGDLTAALSWESDIDGLIGTGGSFSRSDLSNGFHTITAAVTDSGGLTVSDSVSINVVNVLVGAGDIAGCGSQSDEETATLLDSIPGIVFTTGDNVYPDGTGQQFTDCYDPTWGRHKARTRPTPGNHDYHVAGAGGYFNYFGLAAGEPGKGYYSYDLADWHIIALNSECSEVGGCDTTSPQGQWLQADLAANQSVCTLAYWHKPRFSSANHGNSSSVQPLWELLYAAEADVVLNGHDHTYERFAPQDPTGGADPGRGIREFVVGTGGAGLYAFGAPQPNSEVREGNTHGVLKLTLHPTSYDWEFIPIAGQTFTDSGSAPCVSSQPPNDPPLANNDNANTNEDNAVTIDVAANDSDPEGGLDPSSANSTCANGSSGCTGATNGALTDQGDGTITYTPNPNFNGSDSFVYEICDSASACDTATVNITVAPVADPPVAYDDSVVTSEATLVTIDVIANDTDPDGDLRTASASTGCPTCADPTSGTLANNGDGSFDYTPDPGFIGNDGFVYEVCDSLGACDTALVSISVTQANDPPMALDDIAITNEDTAVTIDAAANDSDPDLNLDPTSASTACAGCADPTNGTLANKGDGTFTYTPIPDFNGSDSFVYQICDTLSACDTATVTISVSAVPDPPAANDDSATTLEGTPVTIGVAANDSDVDGDLDPSSTTSICANGCNGATYGTLTDNGDGTITYTPNPSFNGSDSFVYEICDTGGLCDTASVSVIVNLSAPDVVEVRVATSSDDAEESASGSVSLSSSDLELVFTSNSNQTVGMRFNGLTVPQGANITNATIQFQVDETTSEATALIIQGENAADAVTFSSASGNISSRTRTIAAVSWAPPPWSVVGQASPDQQTPGLAPIIQEIVDRPDWASGNSVVIIITGTGKRVAESYNGVASAAPLLHVEYTIGPPNDPPVANDDSASTPEDTSVIIDVAANDSDPEGNLDPASANTACPGCADPSDGSLANNGDGTFTYSPTPDFNGSDGFVYEICDAASDCDTATVNITIDPVADPPIAGDDSASTAEDTPVTIDVVANDSDPDGDLRTASASTGCPTCADPTNGMLANNGDGSFDYTPNPGFIGNDGFIYEVCDSLGACDTAAVNITVTPTNDPPMANDDTVFTDEGTAVTIDVAANDSDPDLNLDPTSANTTCAACTETVSGNLANNGDGTFAYSPNPDFNGSDSFVYEICDTLGACDMATVTISVSAVPDPPAANDDSAITDEGTAVIVDVAANDSDPDGDLDPSSANSTCASGCNGAANGALADNNNGTITYMPNLGFSGSDGFTYEICDLAGLCDTASVSITINPSAPVIVEARVAASSDDAEEKQTGSMRLTSSDLELVFDSGGDQTVGMRFNGVDVPPGANITSAFIQFQVDERRPQDPTALTVQGEDVDNALTFTTASGNISSRPRTSAAVPWSPAVWTTVGEAGSDQRTPDIATIIQQIVDRPGWASGNSLVIIITGTGERVAESYNGNAGAAPLLHVEYTQSVNTALSVPHGTAPAISSLNHDSVNIVAGSAIDAKQGDMVAGPIVAMRFESFWMLLSDRSKASIRSSRRVT